MNSLKKSLVYLRVGYLSSGVVSHDNLALLNGNDYRYYVIHL